MARIRSEEHTRRLRRRLLWKLGGWFLFVAVVVGGLIGLTHWQAIQIKNFTVLSQGSIATSTVNEVVTTKINKDWLGVVSRKNILLLPGHKIRTGVQALSPEVRGAKVSVTGLRSFAVDIQTRKPAMRLCAEKPTSTTCRIADIGGFVYATTTKQAKSAATLTLTTKKLPPVGSRIIPKTTFRTFMAFIRQLPSLGFEPIGGQLRKARDVILHTRKRSAQVSTATTTVDIKINLQDDLQRKFSSLQTVVNRNAFVASTTPPGTAEPPTISPFALEYIDLRFENKVFYR